MNDLNKVDNMRIKIIAIILVFSFFTNFGFSQTKKILKVFEENIDAIESFCGYIGKSVVRHENYTLSLFSDSTYCLEHLKKYSSYINITSKYFILNNTVHFWQDSTIVTTLSNSFNIHNNSLVTMQLIDKQLIGFTESGVLLKLDESEPFQNNFETKFFL